MARLAVTDFSSRWFYSFDAFVFGIENFIDIAFEFFFFRLHIFNCKRDNGPTDLHSHSMKSLEAQLVLQKYNSSEFTSVVFDIESVRFALYNCMASANTYIVNSNLTFVSTA